MKLSAFAILILSVLPFLSLVACQEEEIMIPSSSVLVVGATGATGKHVVSQLLDQNHKVTVIVRSKDRMLTAIGDHEKKDRLAITEAPSLQPDDLPDDQLQKHLQEADVIVSCLGHNLDFKGIWAQPRRLVTDTVRRITAAGPTKKKKFILMGSDGVAHPNDNPRPWYERALLSVLRALIPPHADNEDAAAYLLDRTKDDGLEWIVVRPTDLIDADKPSAYTIYEKPPGGLFGSGEASRVTVAKFMVDLIENPDLWSKYVYQMPVLHNAKVEKKDEL